MLTSVTYYPKLLAFLQLFYPSIHTHLAQISDNPALVESKLICRNDVCLFHAIVFSDDLSESGEKFPIHTNQVVSTPYSWDWRWVFALHILFKDNIIFTLKFKQKVIALPTGKYPLSEVFFENLKHEFDIQIRILIEATTKNNMTIAYSYTSHMTAINI